MLDRNGAEITIAVKFHPGELLEEELQERNISKSGFALSLGIYPSHLSEIIKGKRNITANIALKLESVLKVSAELWLGLQMDYDLQIERKKLKHSD